MFSQVKDVFQSIIDVFKSRTDNPVMDTEGKGSPFGGTYIFIWLICNWKIPFSLFNFDRSYHLTEKISFLNSYIVDKGYWNVFFVPVGYTFLSLLLFFCFSSIAIIFSKGYHTFVLPKVTKWIEGKSSIRTIDQYNTVLNGYIQATLDAKTANENLSIKDEDLKKRLEGNNIRHKAEVELLNNNLNIVHSINTAVLKIQPDVVLGSSDETVIFTGSPDHPTKVKKDTNAVIVSFSKGISSGWLDLHHKYLEKFPKAFWISDRNSVTDEEATKGGMYLFKKTFTLDIDKTLVSSIKLYSLVDDFFAFKINGHYTPVMEEVQPVRRDLHEYDITSECNPGDNTLDFEIRNVKATEPATGVQNPYGFIFSVILRLKENVQVTVNPDLL